MASLTLATACHRHHQPLHQRQLSSRALLFSLPMKKSCCPTSSSSILKCSHIKAMFPGGDQPRLTGQNLRNFFFRSIFLSILSVVSGFLLRRRGRLAIEPPRNQEQLTEEQETSQAEVQDFRVVEIQEAIIFVTAFHELDPRETDWEMMKCLVRRRIQYLDYARMVVDQIRNENEDRIIVGSEFDRFLAKKRYSIVVLNSMYRNHLALINSQQKVVTQKEKEHMSLCEERLTDIWLHERHVDKEVSEVLRKLYKGKVRAATTEEDEDHALLGTDNNWPQMEQYIEKRIKKLNIMKKRLGWLKSKKEERLQQLYEKTCGYKEEYEFLQKQIKEQKMKMSKDRVWHMRHLKNFYERFMREEKHVFESLESLLKSMVRLGLRRN